MSVMSSGQKTNLSEYGWLASNEDRRKAVAGSGVGSFVPTQPGSCVTVCETGGHEVT